MNHTLRWTGIVGLLLTTTAWADPPAPVVLEHSSLGRTRLDHALRARALLRNASDTHQTGRARLVAHHEGGQGASEWADVDLPPGRWLDLALDARETPAAQSWAIELEFGDLHYAYHAPQPDAEPQLQGATPPPPHPPHPTPALGIRGRWTERDADFMCVLLLELHVTGTDDPHAVLNGARITIVAHGERDRTLGRTRARIRRSDLRRDAARIPWDRAAPGTLAWDDDAQALIVAVVRAEDPEDRLVEFALDLEVDLDDHTAPPLERLRAPFRQDPLPLQPD